MFLKTVSAPQKFQFQTTSGTMDDFAADNADTLTCLLDFRRILVQLNKESFIEWVSHFIKHQEQDFADDFKQLFIKALFKQIYDGGEKACGSWFLPEFKQVAQDLLSRQPKQMLITHYFSKVVNNKKPKRKIKNIQSFHENILSYIATFLTNQELFSKYSLLNFRFFKISRKPQSVYAWDFPQTMIEKEYNNFKNQVPKFNIFSLLSQVKRITFELSMCQYFETLSIRDRYDFYDVWPQTVITSMYRVQYITIHKQNE